jgi:hypothetical protein
MSQNADGGKKDGDCVAGIGVHHALRHATAELHVTTLSYPLSSIVDGYLAKSSNCSDILCTPVLPSDLSVLRKLILVPRVPRFVTFVSLSTII